MPHAAISCCQHSQCVQSEQNIAVVIVFWLNVLEIVQHNFFDFKIQIRIQYRQSRKMANSSTKSSFMDSLKWIRCEFCLKGFEESQFYYLLCTTVCCKECAIKSASSYIYKPVEYPIKIMLLVQFQCVRWTSVIKLIAPIATKR